PPFPANDVGAERHAAPAHARRTFDDLRLPEHQPAEGGLRDLEIDLVFNTVDSEDARQRYRFLGDDIVVFLDLPGRSRRWALAAHPATSTAARSLARRLLSLAGG